MGKCRWFTMKQLIIELPKDLYLQIRMSCIHNSTSEEKAVVEILKTYYNSRNKD